MSSSSRRISRSMLRSGRNPVALTTTSASRNASSPDQPNPAVMGLEAGDLEGVDLRDSPGCHEGVYAVAELRTIGELVVRGGRHAERGAIADQPEHLRPRLGLRQLGESDQRVRGRVPRADDDDSLTGERRAFGAEDVRKGVLDEAGDIRGTDRIQTVRCERVGGGVGAGRVDHRAPDELLGGAVAGLNTEQQRRLLTTGGSSAIHALSGDRDHPGAEPDPRPDLRQGGQRLEVVVDELSPGRRAILIHRRSPARSVQQATRSGIDQMPPRREQPRVPPEADRLASPIPALEDREVDAARGQIGRSGEPDRTGADDQHRQGAEPVVGGDAGCQVEQCHERLPYGYR